MTDHHGQGEGETAPSPHTSEESTTNTDVAGETGSSPAAGSLLPSGTRRDFVKAAAVGSMATVLGATAMTGQSAAVTTSSITPSDGFADVGSWLETDNPDVITVTEPTRAAVESAVQASGPRVVVFETSGTIDLGGSNLDISNDRCWLAGQTAPSPGITFIKGTLSISANDCVVQHVRCRVGPGPNGDIQGNDSFNTADDSQNNVVDHVSASWGVDECLSVGYRSNNTTVSNCLIYEGLHDPYGSGEDHNYGSLIGDNATNVALLGNVWAKARGRMPRLKGGTRSVVANNLTYFFDEGANCDGDTVTSFVGNAYLGATDTGDAVLEDGQAYVADNFAAEPSLDTAFSTASERGTRPLWPSAFSAMGAGQVEGHNLDNAGARPADRTGNDTRIVQEIRDRAGNGSLGSPYDYWVGHHSEVGGYPFLPANTHTLNPPSSGLRDWLADWAAQVETGSATGGTSGTSGGTSSGTSGTSGGTSGTSGGTSGGSSGGLWSGGSDDGGSSGGLWGTSGGSSGSSGSGGSGGSGGSSGGIWGGGSDDGGSSGGLWGTSGGSGGSSGGWW